MIVSRRTHNLVLPMAIALAGAWLLVSVLAQVSAQSDSRPPRPYEPVVITGAEIPALQGAPIAELALYAHSALGWTPIPFQVDEVTVEGSYVYSEDGQLDANDELVFMSGDSGTFAGPDDWPDDFNARLHPRVVFTVTDPLQPSLQGWVYLYRSETLARSAESYIVWDEAAQRMTAISYTAAYSPEQFLGLAALTLNGNSIDVLDRQKLRGQVSIRLFGQVISTVQFTEESIGAFVTQSLAISFPVAGPVRAAGGAPGQGAAFYGTRAALSFSANLSDQDVAPFTVAHVDYVTMTFDLQDPAVSGMAPAWYYDGNGANVPIDGVPDAVPAQPPAAWSQISGSFGGWVSLQAVDPANGTLRNFYEDDGTFDPTDTGDGRAFGNAGMGIADPNGVVQVAQTLAVVPPDLGNVGAGYALEAANPLQITAGVESYGAVAAIFVPFAAR